jgi:hypothetical protein
LIGEVYADPEEMDLEVGLTELPFEPKKAAVFELVEVVGEEPNSRPFAFAGKDTDDDDLLWWVLGLVSISGSLSFTLPALTGPIVGAFLSSMECGIMDVRRTKGARPYPSTESEKKTVGPAGQTCEALWLSML